MKNVSIFLDSGAFSAYNTGNTVSIDDYMAYIEKHKDHIGVYVNLDVIGSDEGTWKNQEIMESNGFHPLPVFHRNDDIKYLYRCLEYPYFCLGGIAKGSVVHRREFFDMCWNIICDTPDRLPKSKVHGFGMTSLDFMLMYPWYSVDSSSWLAAGRFGSILVPKRGDYTKAPWKIFVSTRSPKQKEEGQHLQNMTPMEREYVMQYLKNEGFELGSSEFRYEKSDYTLVDDERWCTDDVVCVNQPFDGAKIVEKPIVSGLCNHHILRDYANFVYYRNLEVNLPPYPQPFIMKKGIIKGLGLR